MVKLDIGFGSVDVWIEANGQKLEEFGLQATEGPSRQTCYVASIENASFSVNARTTVRPLKDQLIKVFVDGIKARGKIINEGLHLDLQVNGIQVSNTQERILTFGNLLLNEEDNLTDNLDDSSIYSELGKIRVELYAVQIGSVAPHSSVRPVILPGDNPISEKAKKAGAHAARLGQVRTVPDREFVSITVLDEFPKHDVTFHYAPLDFLRAREIAPRSRGTEFTAVKEEGSSAVKSEGGHNTASGSVAGPSTSAPRKRGLAEFIELSSDDDDGEDNDSDGFGGLTPEERAEFARLQAKKREAKRKGKGKEKARSPVVKRAKTEARDFHHFDSSEVIVVSD